MNSEVYNQLKQIKPILEKKYHLKRLRLFGSHARDDFKPQSDVDLIVEFSQTPSYFSLAGMKIEIENFLGKDVDFVFEQKIFPEFRQSILEDARDV
jgi:uncharacterized protein